MDSPTFRLGGVRFAHLQIRWGQRNALLGGPTLNFSSFPANKSRVILQFGCFHCTFLSRHMPTNRATPTNRRSTSICNRKPLSTISSLAFPYPSNLDLLPLHFQSDFETSFGTCGLVTDTGASPSRSKFHVSLDSNSQTLLFVSSICSFFIVEECGTRILTSIERNASCLVSSLH